jgi:hypothetical protein
MDNNSTFVPGIHNASEPVENFNPYAQPGATGGTFVPGMQANRSAASEEPPKNSMPVNSGDRPVVGFLYSISNGGNREFWPIYVGSNVIGRDSKVDIQLNEATVSGRHAEIRVRELRTSTGLTATIQDLGSKTGILVNNEDPGYDLVKCSNGDSIIIGRNYQMLVILIDTAAVGLSPAKEFIPISVPKQEDAAAEIPSIPQGKNPYDRNSRNIQSGTVDLSGAKSFESLGGTMIME